MEPKNFVYRPQGETVVFRDSLEAGSPCVFTEPRNHESLFLVTEGTLLYERDGETTLIRTGEVGYIARGSRDVSRAFQCPRVSYIAVNFGERSAETAGALPFPVRCSDGTRYPYENWFREALHRFTVKAPGYAMLCDGGLLTVIGHLYREQTVSPRQRARQEDVAPAVRCVEARYGDPELRITELAKACGMSERQLRRVFAEGYGETPLAFLQAFRIRQAQVLLRHTDRTVAEVAQACGFADVYGFSHCFKRHTGTSPQTYRRRV